jgi:hypothetical protein
MNRRTRAYILLLRTVGLVILSWTKITSSVAADISPASSPVLSASDVLPAITELKASTAAGLPPPYIVNGQRIFERGNVLAAEEIVLSPGGRLVLAGPYGDRREKYIIARKITILPGNDHAVITWARGDAPTTIPPPVGKAQPGFPGAQEGADGASGTPGAGGNPGFPGEPAPTIYLAVNEIDGGNLYFDLRGQDGGPGGPGQDGGDGGNGARGNPGSASLFDCKRGGGTGGHGGNGGPGGPGGPGGHGGDGGLLVILASAPALDHIKSAVIANVTPGKGGPGGKGGKGGLLGMGGAGGSAAPPFCGGGGPGSSGIKGEDAQDNKINGTDGVGGTTVGVTLSPGNLSAIGLTVTP